MKKRLARRHAAERRFRFFGYAAIGVAVVMLSILLVSIAIRGWPSFEQTQIRLTVPLDRSALEGLEGVSQAEAESAALRLDFGALVRAALALEFPDVTGRADVRALQALVSSGARAEIRDRVLADRSLIGKTIELWVSGGLGRFSEAQRQWVEELQGRGLIRRSFNWDFFTRGDSRDPELAGILGAVMGSLLSLIVCVAVAFPLGVCAAVYLEEFAPDTRWTRLIEVNINNLAAVPSIVFGLLGLAVFLGFMGMARSAPLVGGLTLALMTLPTVIIAARAAILAVPPSIREAAQGLGASPLQVVSHHVLPLALPGILTGTIIGMARALGETAPLLMIGMVAFVVDVPTSFSDAATALPVQVFLWSDTPERGFVAKTSGAILVLLGFLALMNAAAIVMRQKFETRW